MSRISSGVSVDGPVTAGVVAWRVGPRIRATVVVKACFEFTPSGQCDLVRPLPIFVKDRVGGGGELNAPSDLAPFVPSPEVMVIGRALHRHGTARVGFRVERGGQTIVEKNVDAAANAVLSALAPRRSAWPVPPEAFEQGVQTLPSLDGAAFQRAPADQHATELRGNEEVVLIGLYPSAPLLRFALFAPTIEAHARSVLGGEHVDAVPLRLDAYLLTLADRKCTLLWRGSVPVRSEEALATLKVHVVAKPDPRASAQKAREPAPPSERDVAMGTVGLAESLETITLPFPQGELAPFAGASKKSTLPFPRSQPPARSAAKTQDATPWAIEAAKPRSVVPASSAMTTLPIDDDEPAPEPVRTPSAEIPAAPEEVPASRDPSKPVWREDPQAEAAPPPAPSVAPKLVKKDLNAQLYKRPKPKR